MGRLGAGISNAQIFIQHYATRDHQAKGSNAHTHCQNNEQTARLIDKQITENFCTAHAHLWTLRWLVPSISLCLARAALSTSVLNCSEESVNCSNSCALNARIFAEYPALTRTVAVRRLFPIKAISPK